MRRTRTWVHAQETQGIPGLNKGLQLGLRVQHASIADVIVARLLVQQPVYLPLDRAPGNQVDITRRLRLKCRPVALGRRTGDVSGGQCARISHGRSRSSIETDLICSYIAYLSRVVSSEGRTVKKVPEC